MTEEVTPNNQDNQSEAQLEGQDKNDKMEAEMTFTILHDGLGSCECITQENVGAINLEAEYARKVFNIELDIEDFKSNHEMGKPLSGSGCKAKCKHRGVSLEHLDSEHEKIVKSIWAAELSIKPILQRHYCKFKLKANAGLVWSTPNQRSQKHCDFLKCDRFSVEYIEVVEMVSLLS